MIVLNVFIHNLNVKKIYCFVYFCLCFLKFQTVQGCTLINNVLYKRVGDRVEVNNNVFIPTFNQLIVLKFPTLQRV
jgi:hypothetical protein